MAKKFYGCLGPAIARDLYASGPMAACELPSEESHHLPRPW